MNPTDSKRNHRNTTPPRKRRYGVHARWLFLFFLLAIAADAHAEAPALCPIHGDVPLTQVIHWIETISESRTVTLIQACRITFPLDAAAIDRLAASKASPAVLTALDKTTAATLTVDQAHDQVDALQKHIGEVDAATNKERDAALAKLDADFQAQRDKAAACKPRDQFETTAQYDARCQQSKNAAGAVESQHQTDRNKLNATYAAKAAQKDAPYRNRISFLERATYPDLRAAIYGHYDPGTGQLTMTLGDTEYRFDKVPSATNDTLFKNSQKVKVTQPFASDELLTRNLVFESISISGYSKMANGLKMLNADKQTAAAEVQEAKALMDREAYEAALEKYNHAYKLDDQNEAAMVGAVAAAAAIEQRKKQLAMENGLGEWTDPQTALMWTIYDNRESVNWKTANAYCQTLRIGDHTDWRLPAIEELKTLYDPNSNRNTEPLRKPQVYTDYGQLKNDPAGTTWDYHAKENVLLTGPNAWSATKDDSQGIDEEKVFFYPGGQISSVPVGYKRSMRAHCVRDTVPRPAALQAAQPAPQPKFKPLDVQVFNETLANCKAGDAEQCEMTGYNYEKGNGVDKDLQLALQYYQRACSTGRRACASAKVLASKLAWQK